MPSRLHPMPGRLTADEREQLERDAGVAGLSLGAYVRQQLHLTPLQWGGNRRKATTMQAAIGFKPYRRSDVKTGKGGYVRIDIPDFGSVWATARRRTKAERMMTGSEIAVSLLGWGESPLYDFEQFDDAAQADLRTTL